MKIAVFYNLNFGGAKRVVLEHVKGLRSKGHIVDVYSINPQEDVFSPEKLANKSYEYIFSEEKNLPFSLGRFYLDYRNFFTLKALHKKISLEIESKKYDVVLVHPDKLTQSPFILRFLKTPSIYYCQEPLRIGYEYSFRFKEKVNFIKWCYEELTRLYRKKIDRENVRSATFTLASCCHIRERMIEAYDVIPYLSYLGVDSTSFKPDASVAKNEVFFVGSTNLPQEGYELAEKALKLIQKNKRPKIRVVSWKSANGERLSEEELVSQYNSAITTLCLSRLETFGLVPLESMSCGTPVIATNSGGHRETVQNGKTGYLVEFDPKEIADKITLLSRDVTLRNKLSKAGRKRVKEYWDWVQRIDELDKLLKNLIKE